MDLHLATRELNVTGGRFCAESDAVKDHLGLRFHDHIVGAEARVVADDHIISAELAAGRLIKIEITALKDVRR